MLDIRFVRENPDAVKENIKKKFQDEKLPLVDEVIDYIKSTGLSYYVGPCETSIEGEYDELMEIVKNCQIVAAKAGCKAMNTHMS